jgi:WD40 repeat protein
MMWSPRRQVIIWDLIRERTERAIEDPGLPGQVRASALSPDGRVLAIGGSHLAEDNRRRTVVVLWSLDEERLLYQLDEDATHLAFSPDGRTLLAAGRGGEVRVWDPRDGRLRETIRICDGGYPALHDVALSPDGRHFAAAMANGTVRIYRLEPAP